MVYRIIGVLWLLLLAGCSKPPYENLDSERLAGLLEQDIPVFDIRRPEEWRQTGVIEGSHLLTFVDKSGRLNPEFMSRFSAEVGKGDPVILVCRTGNRSSVLARHLMEQMGYTRIYNVRDGITGWIGDGHPVTRI